MAAVPETMDAFGETGAFEFDPQVDVGVGIRVVTRGGEGDFLQVPNVNFAGVQAGLSQRKWQEQRSQKEHQTTEAGLHGKTV
jgi:hypothetical protein